MRKIAYLILTFLLLTSLNLTESSATNLIRRQSDLKPTLISNPNFKLIYEKVYHNKPTEIAKIAALDEKNLRVFAAKLNIPEIIRIARFQGKNISYPTPACKNFDVSLVFNPLFFETLPPELTELLTFYDFSANFLNFDLYRTDHHSKITGRIPADVRQKILEHFPPNTTLYNIFIVCPKP